MATQKRFIVRADEILTAFAELERAIHRRERSHPVERPGGKNIFTTQK
jgi:hypothetical protein